ncbi:MAG: response regulator [Acetobacteraceae bacterium]|nr:response regulator [Acetobacteraceae bacterium]MBV8524822.1 response regulator [Acetobacteraceae bacterium]
MTDRTRREELIRALPFARRYARALTGNQTIGDRLVAEALRELMAMPTAPEDARVDLYRGVTAQFDRLSGAAGGRVQHGLSLKQRQLLLLTSLEEVAVEDAAPIIAMSTREAARQLSEARDRLRAAAAADVMIIEDEPVIAMDLEELVQSCGHRVVGVASSEGEAVEMARRTRPGLILADINLGIGGDGKHAVERILLGHHAPVIFVTAYPERLLSGERTEPTYVITKPFEPLTLAITTYQAVTGGVHLD